MIFYALACHSANDQACFNWSDGKSESKAKSWFVSCRPTRLASQGIWGRVWKRYGCEDNVKMGQRYSQFFYRPAIDIYMSVLPRFSEPVTSLFAAVT